MSAEQDFEKLSDEDLALIAPFVSDPSSDTFILKTPPGIAGATYARYSRAKGGWKTTFLKEFVKDGNLDVAHADDLIARVLVGFGDDSVGELEGAHLSLENISNLATKAVEDGRIGVAYIEQSSRYVVYDQKDALGRWRYLQDPAKNPIMGSRHGPAFVKGMDRVFEIYCDLTRRLQDHLKKVKPLKEAEYEIASGRGAQRWDALGSDDERAAFKRTWTFDIRSKACDIVRVLLPAATLTNVGLFCNGRAYQSMLTRLYSSEMPEFQVLGSQAHKALDHVLRNYVKRAGRDEFLVQTNRRMQELADRLFGGISPIKRAGGNDSVVLLDNGWGEVSERVNQLFAESCSERFMDESDMDSYDVEAVTKQIPALARHEFQTGMLAYMLYKYTELPMDQLRSMVRGLQERERETIFLTYLGDRRHRRNRSGRALEFGYDLMYDITGDYGIFRDLHRHRMLTSERQRLSTRLGFVELHPTLREMGAGPDVGECVDISSGLYEGIRSDLGRDIAQYPVLFGFNIRFAQGLNDREAQHMWELRTIKQGHPSYRAVCQRMHALLKERDPLRAQAMLFTDYNDYFWSRAESESRQRQKEAQLGLKPGSDQDE